MSRDAPEFLSWHTTIEALARRAAGSLRPDTNRSISSILKIKTLPGGKRSDSRYVDGVVCRLRLADKRMATRLERPRILLLDAPLEHETGAHANISLESLRQQEEEHMALILSGWERQTKRHPVFRWVSGAKPYRVVGVVEAGAPANISLESLRPQEEERMARPEAGWSARLGEKWDVDVVAL